MKNTNWRWNQRTVCDRTEAEEQFWRARYVPSRRWVCEQNKKILGATTEIIRIKPSWNILSSPGKENQPVHTKYYGGWSVLWTWRHKKIQTTMSHLRQKVMQSSKFQSGKNSKWSWHVFISQGVLWGNSSISWWDGRHEGLMECCFDLGKNTSWAWLEAQSNYGENQN